MQKRYLQLLSEPLGYIPPKEESLSILAARVRLKQLEGMKLTKRDTELLLEKKKLENRFNKL